MQGVCVWCVVIWVRRAVCGWGSLDCNSIVCVLCVAAAVRVTRVSV